MDGPYSFNSSGGFGTPQSATADSGPVFEPTFETNHGASEIPDSFDASEVVKTGTTTVGVCTEEGVVLGTDMRASIGGMVSSKTTQKIYEIHPTAATTIAGGVSAAQSLVRNLRAETRLYESRRGENMSITALSTLVANFLRSGAFFVVVPVLGGVDEEGSHVVSYDPVGGMTEEEYAVSGSGSQYALGVLEQEYEEGMDFSAGKDTVIRSLRSAIERDTASGNGARIAEITDEGVETTVYEDVDAIPNPER